LTNKKCYRDAQVTSLARDAPLKESSEYSTEFKKKQAKLEQPVLVRDIDPAKESKRCFQQVMATTTDTNKIKKEGLRGYPAVRASNMPWQPRYAAAAERSDHSQAVSASRGLRSQPYQHHRAVTTGQDTTKRGGLRSSPYCDKFISNIF
jgi:flagella basal body P-ring formation protein FlgA